MSGVARRRGRKRKQGTRHPCGQLKRRTREERASDVTAVAREARQRVHVLSRAEAARPEAADMLGRLAISGEITPAQLSAGRAYETLRRDYDQALAARRMFSASDFNRSGGGSSQWDEADHAAWVDRKTKRYNQIRAALAGCADPLAAMVLDGIVLEGRQMWNFIGTLRLALNAVGRVLST